MYIVNNKKDKINVFQKVVEMYTYADVNSAINAKCRYIDFESLKVEYVNPKLKTTPPQQYFVKHVLQNIAREIFLQVELFGIYTCEFYKDVLVIDGEDYEVEIPRPIPYRYINLKEVFTKKGKRKYTLIMPTQNYNFETLEDLYTTTPGKKGEFDYNIHDKKVHCIAPNEFKTIYDQLSNQLYSHCGLLLKDWNELVEIKTKVKELRDDILKPYKTFQTLPKDKLTADQEIDMNYKAILDTLKQGTNDSSTKKLIDQLLKKKVLDVDETHRINLINEGYSLINEDYSYKLKLLSDFNLEKLELGFKLKIMEEIGLKSPNTSTSQQGREYKNSSSINEDKGLRRNEIKSTIDDISSILLKIWNLLNPDNTNEVQIILNPVVYSNHETFIQMNNLGFMTKRDAIENSYKSLGLKYDEKTINLIIKESAKNQIDYKNNDTEDDKNSDSDNEEDYDEENNKKIKSNKRIKLKTQKVGTDKNKELEKEEVEDRDDRDDT